MEDMLDKQFFIREGTLSEVETKGGTFLPLTLAEKSDSSSTPLRICFNASYKGREGISLNDTLVKGTSHNLSISNLLIHLRMQPLLHISDVSKAYNGVRIAEDDQKFLRVLYRDGGYGSGGQPVVLKSTRLTFGVRPAQAMFSISRNLAFDHSLSSELRDEVKNLSYTDNLHLLSSSEEEGKNKTSKVTESLQRMGFSLKNGWTTNGVESVEQEKSLLGLTYNQVGDQLYVQPVFNLGKRVRGEKPKKDNIISQDMVNEYIRPGMSKRDLLVICHAIYDPTGFYVPAASALKHCYRNVLLVREGLGWEQAIPESFIPEIKKIIKECLKINKYPIDRYAMQGWEKDLDGELRLICFTDAGDSGQIARVFLQSIKPGSDGKSRSTYMVGKHKLNSEEVAGSVPRAEISALLLGARALNSMLKVRDPRIKESLLVSDSCVALSLTQSQASSLSSWTAIRISEVKEILERHKITPMFISGVDNPADIGSKRASLQIMFTPGYWMPAILQDSELSKIKKIEEVMVRTPKEFIKKELRLHVNRTLILNNEFVQTILSRKTSFQKVVGILTRILSWKYEKLEAREKAKRFLLNSAKPGEKQIEGLKRKFAVESKDEAVFAETRAFVDPEGMIITKKYRVLDKKSPVIRLIINDIHMHGSGFLNHFNAVLREGYYAVNLKKIIKHFLSKCVTCRKFRLLPSSSEQSPQTTLIYANGAPFDSVQVDFAGEFFLQDRIKAYVLLTICAWSGAVTFQPITSLTATDTLKALEVSMNSVGRTLPSRIYCDAAPSFLALRRVERAMDTAHLSDLEYIKMKTGLVAAGVEVRAHAAYAAFRTGKVERSVQMLKRFLKSQYGYLGDLSYVDFTYLISKAAFVINNRPIGAYDTVHSTFCLSPIDLIHPAQSQMISTQITEFPQTAKLWKHYNHMLKLHNGLKSMFINLFIERALRRNKKSSKRILVPGDVVLILDRLSRGLESTMAEVMEVDESNKNIIVRTITRPATVDRNYKIVTPAKVTRLLRAPESLVFLFRKNQEVDILEYSNLSPFSANKTKRWSLLEELSPAPSPSPGSPTLGTSPLPPSDYPED